MSQSTQTRLRLAAVYSHPAQYTAPLFREISRRTEVDFIVYFLSRLGAEASLDPQFGCVVKWDTPLLQGYKYKFVPNLRRTESIHGFAKLLNLAIVPEIVQGRYDCVMIHGYDHVANWLALVAGKLSGARMILRGESHLNEPRGFRKRALKRLVLPGLFHQFDSFACIGTLNREYYKAYRVDESKIFCAPYSVDNEFFSTAAGLDFSTRAEIRRELGVSDDAPLIVSLAKLIDVKQPELLLRAYAAVRKRHHCHLAFVGDGALRGRIESLTAAEKIPGVHITGFVNQSRIPLVLASADIFVLPSCREPWGLAVNEAMAVGLPVIVSDRVGSAIDLVAQGENGYIFPYQNAEALAHFLEMIVADPEARIRFSQCSRDRIRQWGIEKTADGIIRAAHLDTVSVPGLATL